MGITLHAAACIAGRRTPPETSSLPLMKFTSLFRTAAALAIFISAAGLSRGQVINGGFETGNFTGWTLSSGAQASVVGSVTDYPVDPWTLTDDLTNPYSVNPYAGRFMARLVAGTTKLTRVESFLNLGAGALSNATNNPFGLSDAAAIQQDVWLSAGLTINVGWNFLAVDTAGIDDFAFLSLSGAGHSWVNILSSVDSVGAGMGTGWRNAQITVGESGLYRLGLGVANFGDDTVSSILYADAISAVPEPSTYGIFATFSCICAMAVRRRRARTA